MRISISKPAGIAIALAVGAIAVFGGTLLGLNTMQAAQAGILAGIGLLTLVLAVMVTMAGTTEGDEQ